MPVEGLWFISLDTARRRMALNARRRFLAEAVLRTAFRPATVCDACAVESGIRAIIRARSAPDVRAAIHRFVGLYAAATRCNRPLWRAQAQLVPVPARMLPRYRKYLQRCRATRKGDRTGLKTTRNGKRSRARRAIALLQRIEQANAETLGIDEWNARVRRYVAAHDAPADDTAAFERLCMSIFAQGFGFSRADAYREALHAALCGFVPTAMAAMDDRAIAAALLQPIIRNRAKIQSCVRNAGRWVELASKHGTYMGRVAALAANDDAAAGWPALIAMLREDFVRCADQTARLILKRWGFFTALPHPGCARLLQRLGLLDDAPVQNVVAAMAQ